MTTILACSVRTHSWSLTSSACRRNSSVSYSSLFIRLILWPSWPCLPCLLFLLALSLVASSLAALSFVAALLLLADIAAPPSAGLPRHRRISRGTGHGVQDQGVATSPAAGVAGGADLVDPDQHGVAVAVQRHRLHPLLVAGRLALDPVLTAAARPVGAPAGGQRAVQRLVVHPAQHEHLAGVVLLRNGRDQPVRVALQPRGHRRVQRGVRHPLVHLRCLPFAQCGPGRVAGGWRTG